MTHLLGHTIKKFFLSLSDIAKKIFLCPAVIAVFPSSLSLISTISIWDIDFCVNAWPPQGIIVVLSAPFTMGFTHYFEWRALCIRDTVQQTSSHFVFVSIRVIAIERLLSIHSSNILFWLIMISFIYVCTYI